MLRVLRLALINVVAASSLVSSRVRRRLFRLAGFRVGDSTIMSEVYVGGPYLTIGDGCFINRRCLFDAGADIAIEDRVFLAYNVSLLTGTHEIGGAEQRASVPTFHPVRVGAGSWLGANATVLPGVTIAPGCIVAAGAMVTEDTAPHGLYAGVPARRVRDLATDDG